MILIARALSRANLILFVTFISKVQICIHIVKKTSTTVLITFVYSISHSLLKRVQITGKKFHIEMHEGVNRKIQSKY